MGKEGDVECVYAKRSSPPRSTSHRNRRGAFADVRLAGFHDAQFILKRGRSGQKRGVDPPAYLAVPERLEARRQQQTREAFEQYLTTKIAQGFI